MSRHVTIRLFKPTGAGKRMTPIITPCSIYGDIRILALSGAIAFISTSFTPSPANTALKKAAKVVWMAVGAVVGIILWAIFRPIFRGVGWLISILTAIGIIYWLLTL